VALTDPVASKSIPLINPIIKFISQLRIQCADVLCSIKSFENIDEEFWFLRPGEVLVEVPRIPFSVTAEI